ncbi:MAG: 2'-5' RNA ligase family protein [Holosporales bacterium]
MSQNAFLAIVPSDSTKLEIKQKLRLPFPPDQVRWVKQQNLHITLGYVHDLEREDRPLLAECFKPLAQLRVFKAVIRKPIILGTGNTLCGAVEPLSEMAQLREVSMELLAKGLEGRYDFDRTYDFLPHIKVQSVRKALPEDMKAALRQEFMMRPFHPIEFKVHHVAWMERAGDDYRIIRSFYLR